MRHFILSASALALAACGGGSNEGAYGMNTDDLYDTWLVTSVMASGADATDTINYGARLTLSDTGYEATVAGGLLDMGELVIDDTTSPPRMDITGTQGPNAGNHIKAIYKQTPTSLTISYDMTGEAYPADFESKPGRPDVVITYERME